MHCATDILAWLPLKSRNRVLKCAASRVRDLIFDELIVLDLGSWTSKPFCFGNVHIAGPPCVDFSPMGAQKREGGPSMRCFFVWARALREQRPYLNIIESVPRFPLSLVLSLFDDLHTVEHCVLEAADTGAPVRRRRLYCVLTLMRVARLSRLFFGTRQFDRWNAVVRW